MSVHDFVMNILKTHGAVTLILTDSKGRDVLAEADNKWDFLDLLDDYGYRDAKLLCVDVDYHDPVIWIYANIM